MERALVISASGVRLVYEVAVLDALLKVTSKEERAWRHVYGTSGGSLLASFLCQYPVGQEEQAIHDMKDLIARCAGDNGMRSYFPFGMIQGLLWSKSLHDPSFLETIIRNNIDQEKIRTSGRHLYVLAVDYSESNGKAFTEDHQYIKDAVLGSCSIPMVFPPHPINDPSSPTGITYLGDGGMTDFIAVERAALNPLVGHIDAILSVGEKDARVFTTAPKGKYPDLTNIMSTVMEGFYKLAADQTEKTITRINSTVLLKKMYGTQIPNVYDLPSEEKRRLNDSMRDLERNTFISCKLFKPVTPFMLSATGGDETIGQFLWDSGYSAVAHTMGLDDGTSFCPRTLNI